jgi:ABC-type transport system substrate-binding protein
MKINRVFIIAAILAIAIIVGAPAPAPAPTAAPPTAAPPAATTAPQATAVPAAKFNEAPAVAEIVKSGKLPAVAQRLPEKPLVITGEAVGAYGGVLRRGFTGPSDANHYYRLVNDGLVRYNVEASKIEPKIAESVESSADFKTWTPKLRKGA